MSQISNDLSSSRILSDSDPSLHDAQSVKAPKATMVNPKLLGVTDKLSREDLGDLSHSPSTVEKLADRKLEEFDEGVETQRKIKMQVLEAKVATGKMSREDMQAELKRLEDGWKADRNALAGKLSLQYETARTNRSLLSAKALGKVDESDLQKLFGKWDDIDKAMARRYVKEKPQLNADGSKSTVWSRLFSKQGAITAGTAVAAVGCTLLGTILAPLVGSTIAGGALVGAAYAGLSTLFGVAGIISPTKTKVAADFYDGVRGNLKGEIHVKKDYKENDAEVSEPRLKAWMDEHGEPPRVARPAGDMPLNSVGADNANRAKDGVPPVEQPLNRHELLRPEPEPGVGGRKIDDEAEVHREALKKRKKALSDELLKEEPDMRKVATLESMVRALTVLVDADNVLAGNAANVRQIQQGMNDAMKM